MIIGMADKQALFIEILSNKNNFRNFLRDLDAIELQKMKSRFVETVDTRIAHLEQEAQQKEEKRKVALEALELINAMGLTVEDLNVARLSHGLPHVKGGTTKEPNVQFKGMKLFVPTRGRIPQELNDLIISSGLPRTEFVTKYVIREK